MKRLMLGVLLVLYPLPGLEQATQQKAGSAKTATKKNTTKRPEEKEDALDLHYIRGVLVTKSGVPVAGAYVCVVVKNSEGQELIPMGLKGGRLRLPAAKSDAKGGFRIELEGSWRFKLGLCEEGKDRLGLKLISHLPGNEVTSGEKREIDVGKIVVFDDPK